MIDTAIILAGGFGTRLQSVVSDVPKPMALVDKRPFLEYLMAYASDQGIKNVILSVGYKHQLIIDHFGHLFMGMSVKYAIEDSPLGTGGAIWNALSYCQDGPVIILNGDSFLKIDFQAFGNYKQAQKADMVLALKPMQDFDRYGLVSVDENNRILEFKEKKYCKEGLINGGIYCFDTNWAKDLGLSGQFSFEKEILEAFVKSHSFLGFISEGYFIDIGIPEDYERAQVELPEKIISKV